MIDLAQSRVIEQIFFHLFNRDNKIDVLYSYVDDVSG